jgi:N-acetylmuramoyl-L-alanine amidase
LKKHIFSRLIRTVALVVLIAVVLSSSSYALSRSGSRGNEVIKIQTKLKNWGYYTGSVDGVYGSKTVAAVRWFQSKNGLTVDGIAGPATLAAMGIMNSSTGSTTSYSNDLNLLAKFISAEARGESYTGQVAVGAVILNRVKHPSFPKTVAGVVYQRGAFTCVTDGQINQPVIDSAYKAARDAMNGWDPTYGAIYYYNPATATSTWIYSRQTTVTIGNHVFAK